MEEGELVEDGEILSFLVDGSIQSIECIVSYPPTRHSIHAPRERPSQAR